MVAPRSDSSSSFHLDFFTSEKQFGPNSRVKAPQGRRTTCAATLSSSLRTMLARAARLSSARLAATASPALRPLVVSSRAKTTTGIVGLEVEPDAKAILVDLYAQTLSALESVPKEASYRSSVAATTTERLAIVKGLSDLEAMEAAIGAGQIEEVVKQAREELALIPVLVEANAFAPYEGFPASGVLEDLKRCACVLAKHARMGTTARCSPSHWHKPVRAVAGEASLCSATTSR